MASLRGDIERFGVEQTADLLAHVAMGYSHVGDFRQAYDILHPLVHQQKDTISVTGLEALQVMVENCRNAEELHAAVELVQFLVEERGNPNTFGIDRYTYLSKLCRRVLKREEQLKIDTGIPPQFWKCLIDDITSSSLQPTLSCYTSLLALQVQLSLAEAEKQHRKESLTALKDAEELLSKMRYEGFTPSLYVYNILIHGYSSLSFQDMKPDERLTRALKVLDAMKAVDVGPNTHTYTSLFNACLPTKSWSSQIDQRVMEVEKDMRNAGLAHDVVSSGTFTRVLGAGRLYEKMFEAFIKMRHEGIPRDLSIYNTLLHASKETPTAALRAMSLYFEDTRKYPSLRPNFLTCRWLLDCCGTTKKSKLAEWIVTTYAKDMGILVEAATLNSLLSVLVKCEEEEGIDRLVTTGFTEHRLKPTRDTVKIVLSYYCLKKQDLVKAAKMLQIFEKRKLERDSMCVDLLARGYFLEGRTDEGLELLRDPLCDKGTFQTLLRDPQVRKPGTDYRTAKKVFEVLKEVAPQNNWTDAKWYKSLEANF